MYIEVLCLRNKKDPIPRHIGLQFQVDDIWHYVRVKEEDAKTGELKLNRNQRLKLVLADPTGQRYLKF